MTLLMTLLTLFLGGKPTAAVPPEPARATTAVAYEEAFDTTQTTDDPFGLPLVTSASRHASPSLMVAVPPKGLNTAFDVFSPAVRPPHEFPTLFPCEAVALVPCPPPLPAPEPPAIRHVSFAGEGADFRVARLQAQANAEAEAGTCPLAIDHHPFRNVECEAHCLPPGLPGHAFTHRVLGHVLPVPGLWGQLHIGHHAPPHHPAPGIEAAQLCQPVGAYPVCPVGFGGPADGLHSPFPGAKSVQHVVSATYDVPSHTAKALVLVLEKSGGVLGCEVHGDELTINATAPAQMAIAQFLATVVTQPKSTTGPAKTISVRYTETKPCTTECTETKACTTECCGGKCCEGKCGEKCGCTCGKTKPAASEPSAQKTSDKGLFSFYVGLADCKACPLANGQPVGISCQVPVLGQKAATDCPATACEPVSVQVKATQTKPVIVKIQATKDGVLLQTSDGTQIRAQSIQLETHGLGKLQVQQAEAVHTQPKAATKPLSALPTY